MKLTDSIIKAAKPAAKAFPLADGAGLVLLVQPTGAKWWRVRYRYLGAAKMLSIGVYPEVTLKAARERCAEIKAQIAANIDPSIAKQEKIIASKLAAINSFESVALEWWAQWRGAHTSLHANRVLSRLKADLFPAIGSRPIQDITAPMLLAVAKKIQGRGAINIAQRSLATSGQIFRYAVAHGYAERSPAADIKPTEALITTVKVNHARLDESELPALLLSMASYDGQPLTRYALELMALTFVRTSELIGARWDEFDLAARQWKIPAERMKMRTPHIVALSTQTLALLERLQLLTGNNPLLFPSERGNGQSMSNNTILYALYRMGYHGRMTGHGFRGMASTILHEQDFPHEHIELQLAHSERNKVSAAYNHAKYLKPRALMMQAWADYLDSQRGAGAAP
jgi:integrase